MRIGILTLPLHTNYGGILQAYALQTALERMGHDVVVINKIPGYRLPLWKTPLVYTKRIIKNLVGESVPVFYERKMEKGMPIIRQHTDKFIKRYIHTLDVKDYSDLKENDFDAIIVGSDQVWRPRYFGRIEDAYLDFAKTWDIKRIVYAASFGTDEWEYSRRQTKNCSRLVKKFANVSVREKSGIGLCQEYLGVNANHVLDPTMLLTRDDYIKLFQNIQTLKSSGTLFSYILDETPEKQLLINEVSQRKGLVPFRVKAKIWNRNVPIIECIQSPVEQWLRGFYDAEFVVTDSFHACVFSIIFNKPFLAIGNIDRGLSRFESLLSTFKIEDRLKTSPDHDFDRDKEIDWNIVNSIMCDKIYISMKYISDNFVF